MITVVWDARLKAEYAKLFDTCVINESRVVLADSVIRYICNNKDRYTALVNGHTRGMPWWMLGCIHLLEAALSFNKHLHNGDPLSARTTRVPKGRPATGNPPFTWEQSAADALALKGLDKEKDWSIPRILFLLEGYNGYGYRQYHPTVKSPYLWSFTNHYTKGKYVADGKFDPNCVSQQLGIAAVIKRGLETKQFC